LGAGMLKRDPNGHFVSSGLIFKKYEFQSGKLGCDRRLNQAQYGQLLETQEHTPVAVCNNPSNSRVWWLFRSQFYWEDEQLSEREVKALVLERLRKRTKQVERAVATMDGTLTSGPRRERIPDSVQAEVWNRDGGCCVKCGSQERLEYDHVIPLSKGGSNTARNLQLLCEICNRSKGASIG